MDMLNNQDENLKKEDINLGAAHSGEDFSEEEASLAASADELQLEDNENIDSEESGGTATANFETLSREEMLKTFAQLLDSKPVQEMRQEAEALKVAFYKKYKQEVDVLRKAFVAEGNEEETFVAPEDGLEQQLKDLFARYKRMRAEYSEKIEQEREGNLRKKLEIIEELKALPERQDDFNNIFNDFKNLQNRWREIGLVPQAQQNEIWRTYNHNVEKFYDMVKINNELRELDFKKNLELKQQLCEKTEELLLEDNVVEAFRKLQKYHEQWREIGPVAKEFRESVWERFKEATSQINKKHQAYFEGLKDEQQKNLELKQGLSEKAEELGNTVRTTIKEWNDATNELIELQKVWKTIGFAPRKENVKIFQRFRTACNTFFDNRRAFFKEIKSVASNNLQQKLELCAQAEALANSEDWKKTTDQLIALQKRWKEIGPTSRKHSEQVWKRFRAACDSFFDRKKSHFAEVDAKYDGNLLAKEQLIAEIKNFEAKENPQENLAAIKAFQQRWVEIGYVPMKDKERIQNEYHLAIDKLYSTLHVEESERKLMNFKAKIEGAEKGDGGNKRHLFKERDKLIQQLKRIEADIKLWENNIGFFSKSKNADKLIQDVQRNIEKAKREAAVLEEKIKMIEKL